MSGAEEIKAQAKAEVSHENFRVKVEEEKAKIRSKRRFLFPWRVKVSIINLNKEA
jgi:hypothetical protein